MLKAVLITCVAAVLVSCRDAGSLNGEDGANGPGSSSNFQSQNGDLPGEGGYIGGGGDKGGDGGYFDGYIFDKFTQSGYTNSYDFLWVIDNSGSMSNIHDVLRQNLTAFVDVLESRRALDWQMAVTNSDAYSSAGALIADASGNKVVRKGMGNFAAIWAGIISNIVGTATSGFEEGLESGWQALDRYSSDFSRRGIPLVVTYVSDEQDYSCESNCHNFAVQPENYPDVVYYPVDRYSTQFNNYKAQTGSEVIVNPIVHLVDLGVPGACDDVGTRGTRYMLLEEAMGNGSKQSICPDSLLQSINNVAQVTADRGVCFHLSHPIGSMEGFYVKVDGVDVAASSSDGYALEGPNVCFNGNAIPINGQKIEIRYRP